MKLNHETYAREFTVFLPSTISSSPPEISSKTVLLGVERFARLIDVADLHRLAELSVPPSGCSCPTSIRNSVVLPAPFGPMTPTMPPRGSVKSRSSMSSMSP